MFYSFFSICVFYQRIITYKYICIEKYIYRFIFL